MLKYFLLLRPAQWIKNLFVFTGLFFSGGWKDTKLIVATFLVFLGFCLVSSSVYIFNDICDREKDRAHPEKSSRPIASRKVSIFNAIWIALSLLILGTLIGFYVSSTVLLIFLAYVLLNSSYSLYLKHIVVLDVFCIAIGFMMRIFAGTAGVGIPPSQWLMICGLMITLFLGFAKRRAEYTFLGEKKGDHRGVLEHYSKEMIDLCLAMSGASTILTYSLYTMADETIRFHHTANLIYTVPFVVYGIFRYIYLLVNCKKGGSPTKDLIKDKHILITVTCWMLLFIGFHLTSF